MGKEQKKRGLHCLLLSRTHAGQTKTTGEKKKAPLVSERQRKVHLASAAAEKEANYLLARRKKNTSLKHA